MKEIMEEKEFSLNTKNIHKKELEFLELLMLINMELILLMHQDMEQILLLIEYKLNMEQILLIVEQVLSINLNMLLVLSILLNILIYHQEMQLRVLLINLKTVLEILTHLNIIPDLIVRLNMESVHRLNRTMK